MTNVDHATVGSKPAAMPATAPTVNSSKPSAAPAVEPTAPAVKATSISTAAFGKCRNVCHDAKRAHRNTGRQNAYCSLRHDAFPTSKS
jgi:hypothetical protein